MFFAVKIQFDIRFRCVGAGSRVNGVIQNIYHQAAEFSVGKWQILWCIAAEDFNGNSLCVCCIQFAVQKDILCLVFADYHRPYIFYLSDQLIQITLDPLRGIFCHLTQQRIVLHGILTDHHHFL